MQIKLELGEAELLASEIIRLLQDKGYISDWDNEKEEWLRFELRKSLQGERNTSTPEQPDPRGEEQQKASLQDVGGGEG